jgi:trehalose 6-phosphate synthase/phosphatase
VLRGLLGADLVGFHTAAYARHFAESVTRGLGLPATPESVAVDGRTVRVGVFPIGVDAAAYAARPEVDAEVAALAPDAAGHDLALFVGVDRLDYTKGIPRCLLAFEQLLVRHPALRERVRSYDVHAWADSFLAALAGSRGGDREASREAPR